VKFRVSDEVEAPANWVWKGFTDFTFIEAEALANGADLTRVGGWSEPRVGASWHGAVQVRGKARAIEAQVSAFMPPEALVIQTRIGGMRCQYEVALDPLATAVTRVSVMLELSAATMSAKLLLQSMKVARRRVHQRLEGAVVRQGQEVERAWRLRAQS
jgi:cell division protein ZapA (FtsZ GTPase activity inhibitor)